MSVDHDSVVARPTYARTMQIEQTPLPEHLHATLPSTINAKGVTIANVVHPELRHRDDANNHGFNASQGGGELGSFLVGDFGEISSPNSLHSRARPPASRVMEIDVSGSRSRAPGGINGNGVGFTSQPNSPDRGLTSKSQMSNLGDRTGNDDVCMLLSLLLCFFVSLLVGFCLHLERNLVGFCCSRKNFFQNIILIFYLRPTIWMVSPTTQAPLAMDR